MNTLLSIILLLQKAADSLQVSSIPADAAQETSFMAEFKEFLGISVGVVTIIGTVIGIIVGIRSLKRSEKSKDGKKQEKFSMRTVKASVNEIVDKAKNDGFDPSLIIGIGRGGGIFGSLISYKLNHRPLVVIDRDYDWKTGDRKESILYDFDIPGYLLDRVLLVAGEAHTGATMRLYKEHLTGIGAGVIKTCAFYRQLVCKIDINYCSKEGDGSPLMPWQDAHSHRDSLNRIESETLKEERPSHPLEGKTFYIVRHGETDNNKNDVFIGTTDAQLNAQGINQLKQLGGCLNSKECLTKNGLSIYSSPQKRAYDSACIIAQALHMDENDIKKDNLLRERNYGAWENKGRLDIQQVDPDLYDRYDKGDLDATPPGADELTTLIRNIQLFLANVAKDPNDKIIIVTHKTTGRLLLSYFAKKPYSQYREIRFDNGSAWKCTVKDGQLSVDGKVL